MTDELSQEMLHSLSSSRGASEGSWMKEVEASLAKAEKSRSHENTVQQAPEVSTEFSSELLSSQEACNAKKCAECGFKCIEGCS